MHELTGSNSAGVQSQPSGAPIVAADPDLAAIPEELWAVARERFAALKPLIEAGASSTPLLLASEPPNAAFTALLCTAGCSSI